MPQNAYFIVVAAFACFAVATAWRYGGQVGVPNRVWTRAWLIVLCAPAAGPSGWLVPFDAIYVLLRYRKVWNAPLASAPLLRR